MRRFTVAVLPTEDMVLRVNEGAGRFVSEYLGCGGASIEISDGSLVVNDACTGCNISAMLWVRTGEVLKGTHFAECTCGCEERGLRE